jgi:hypothetical protein
MLATGHLSDCPPDALIAIDLSGWADVRIAQIDG